VRQGVKVNSTSKRSHWVLTNQISWKYI